MPLGAASAFSNTNRDGTGFVARLLKLAQLTAQDAKKRLSVVLSDADRLLRLG